MLTTKSLAPSQGLFVDIEAVPGGAIFGLGVVLGSACRKEALERRAVAALLGEFPELAKAARFVAGHNIIEHDLPVLDAEYGIAVLRSLPAVDTLYLSPLAFPKNPYHRLTKNDRLVRSAKNHPARDCESSRTILEDAIAAFANELEKETGRDRLALTRWLLAGAELPWNGSRGMDLFFDGLGVPELAEGTATDLWGRLTAAHACPDAARREWSAAASDPKHRAALAYVLAWLQVAGSDSVIPGWVRHRFPKTAETIKRLRSTPCGDTGCKWCSQTQDPTKQLTRFFGFPAFRLEPAVRDNPGKSLQEEIVRLAMGGRSVLGILPTGGGKSLCFQIPALHRFFTTGALTIVVTPLQALMKDQVDGLMAKTGTPCAAALYGMQTPPEKAEVREAVRLGSIGILYVSPEQLRNASFKKTITQREIGCWVFDEAHCLSQWGHDFRPDYVYIARFIREFAAEQRVPVPPVLCVTATAKDDVKNEIVKHFRETLGHELVLLDGGTSRDNLSYRIEQVTEYEKPQRIGALLTERIGDGLGAAVVFAATRNRVTDFAEQLARQGWSTAAFHAGLPAEQKKAILEDFLGGKIQVVVATNAFGMGIDKPNIRLVVHVDTPGSLENYLQEAGRAGRDQNPAECVLLFNPEDLETQFGLFAASKIEKRDIDQIWRAISRSDPGDGNPITVTISEILDGATEAPSFVEESDDQRGTKVKTALAVLEKQGFLERDENQTRVLQARPLVADEQEAKTRMARLDLPQSKQALWLDVLSVLMNQDSDRAISMDDFAELPRMRELYDQLRRDSYARVSPYVPVFQVLNEMAQPEAGMISKDVSFSARLRVGRTGHAKQKLESVVARERALIDILQHAEANPDGWVPLALRRVNQELVAREHASLPDDVTRILRTLSSDARKAGRASSILEFSYRTNEYSSLRLAGTWTEVIELATLRQNAAGVLVDLLMQKARAAQGTDGTLALVVFGESEVLAALNGDMTLDLSSVRELTAFVQYLLVYLHENDVIELKNGKALISQAMTLRVLEKRKGKQWRRFTKGDYAALSVHYSEKVFQIHVMGEYARMGIERLGAHLRLISAYFQMGKAAFAARFLREKPEVYERATGIDSFRKVVDDLRNPVQQAIVAESAGSNMLILAGPGSGKTRVIAHRCAYLLRVERVRPERILVACFNRHAALQLRRQIYRLVDKDACRVMIQTYHGLALRLLGRSFCGEDPDAEAPDFTKLLKDATQLLAGKPDDEQSAASDVRDRVLAGFSHILVDEYQDVDEDEYAFISAIAGRREVEDDRKLAIIAVGDDDQSIYGFKGANVAFIRRFQQDYQAREHYLTENYRSTKAIIAAANRLIGNNKDRMKIAQPIRVNRMRDRDPAGGRWEGLDPLIQGNVQRVRVADSVQQGAFIAQEIRRLKDLDSAGTWANFAVIGRTRDELVTVRSALDDAGIAVDWRADEEMPISPFQVREVHAWLSLLAEKRDQTWTAAQVKEALTALRGSAPVTRWWTFIEQIWSEWAGEAGDAEVCVAHIREFFVEAVAERRRADRTGAGVVLVTAHKAKGLEFPHVLVADGKWGAGRSQADLEEERRVYYVAMTRAKETLTLLVRNDQRTSFPGEISGENVVDRTPRPVERTDASARRSYSIIHPAELFISYAGRKAASDPVHSALRGTFTGNPVRFVQGGNWVLVETETGVPIAALSEQGKSVWASRIGRIKSATITAMVRRTIDQEGDAYREKARVLEWEFPVIEVSWAEG